MNFRVFILQISDNFLSFFMQGHKIIYFSRIVFCLSLLNKNILVIYYKYVILLLYILLYIILYIIII